MAKTTNNSVNTNTNPTASETTEMPNATSATKAENNTDKLVMIREYLQECNNTLLENASKNVDSVLDIILKAVSKDPIFFLTERKVVFVFANMDSDLTGFRYCTNLTKKYNMTELQKYLPGIAEEISHTNSFICDIQAKAFINRSPAFECFITEADTLNINTKQHETIKRLAVMLDLDAI